MPMKKRSERRKHCAPAAVPHGRTESAMAVVRQNQNSPPPPQNPFPGAQDGQYLISWRGDGHYLHLHTQFGEDRCTQFQVIVVTDTARPPQTHAQTHRQDRLQYTTPLASAQCNKRRRTYRTNFNEEELSKQVLWCRFNMYSIVFERAISFLFSLQSKVPSHF